MPPPRAEWLSGRALDLAIAWAWVPFFAVGAALDSVALMTSRTRRSVATRRAV